MTDTARNRFLRDEERFSQRAATRRQRYLDDALDALPPGIRTALLMRFDEQAARIATLEQQVADLTTLVVPEGSSK